MQSSCPHIKSWRGLSGASQQGESCPPHRAHHGRRMATFVPYASCYRNKQAVQPLGRDSYFSLFANPPCLLSQRQPLVCPAPEMTLRQISQLIRILRQLRRRDAKEAQPPPPPRRSRSASVSTGSQRSRSSANPCLHCFSLPCVG